MCDVSREVDDLWARLVRIGTESGLDRMGVAGVEPFAEMRRELEARKADGSSARLGFTYRWPNVATDIRVTHPWAERFVVGARSYLPGAGDPGPDRSGTGRIARALVSGTYHPLRMALLAVAEELRQGGYRAEVMADDSRLVDRAVAVRAGLGWWGKNSMVLAPGLGPWFLIGSVVTDALLPTGRPLERNCGACSACLPACPTGALVAPGVLDARHCLAAWAQAPGVIPVEYRPLMGDRLYGCDDCLEACPPGHRLLDRARRITAGRVDLVEILTAADRALLRRFGHLYLPGSSPRCLRRNALIALGNQGEQGAVALIARYAGHPDWLLRAHAAWALGRLGGLQASAALEQRHRLERDPRVRQELAPLVGSEPRSKASTSAYRGQPE